MASRYWVSGGSGNWSSTTNWSATSGGASGASVPGTADAAIFNSSSGNGTATVDSNVEIQTLTMTGFTGTLAFGTNTISLNSTGTIYTGDTTYTVTGTPQIISTNSSSTNRTIACAAVTESNSVSVRVSAGSGTLTTTGTLKNLDLTDGTNPTGFAGSWGSNVLTIYGDLKLSTGVTVVAGNQGLTFAATSSGKKITSAGKTIDRPIVFNGVGGIWQLQDTFTAGSTRAVTLTNGTLDLAGFTCATGIFSSTNSNTRAILFGVGNITLTGNAATVLNMATATNFTYTGTPTFNANYSGSTGTRTFSFGSAAGATEANAVNLNITAGTDIIAGTDGNAWKNLNFTGFAGTWNNSTRTIYGNLTVSSGMTLTAGASVTTFAATSGTQQVTSNGKTMDFPVAVNAPGAIVAFQDAFTQGTTRDFTFSAGTVQFKNGVTSTVGNFITSGTTLKYLQSTSAGSQATLSEASGTVTATYLSIKDSNATGGATWNAYVDQFNIDAGNNDGWDFGVSPVVGGVEYTYQLRSFTEPRRF
jgi:hypothetical protein